MQAHKQIANDLLVSEEGFREKPYYCTERYPTIGIGFKIGEKNAPLPDIRMTMDEAKIRLGVEIDKVDHELSNDSRLCFAYDNCNDVRKAVMISMAFQLGIEGLAKFKQTLRAIGESNFKLAGDMMLDSLVARQTPARWIRAAKYMRSGEKND